MYSFGARSRSKLVDVHHDMVRLACVVISRSKIDFGITCGGREIDEQALLFVQGKTRTMKSKHLKVLRDELSGSMTSGAIDIVCYINGKVTWEKEPYIEVSKLFLEVSEELGIPIRWGGDWDRDGDMTDQKFNDYPHYELWAGKYRYDFDKLEG